MSTLGHVSRKAYQDPVDYITVGGRRYVARLKFGETQSARRKKNIVLLGFEKNDSGEILYVLPGGGSATARELLRAYK